MKASVFRRWPVTAPYRGEQTTRLTGGYDFAGVRARENAVRKDLRHFLETSEKIEGIGNL